MVMKRQRRSRRSTDTPSPAPLVIAKIAVVLLVLESCAVVHKVAGFSITPHESSTTAAATTTTTTSRSSTATLVAHDVVDDSGADVRGEQQQQQPWWLNNNEAWSQHASSVVRSYEPEPFNPWIANPHVQTILGFLLRNSPCTYLPQNNNVEATRRVVTTLARLAKDKLVKSSGQQSTTTDPESVIVSTSMNAAADGREAETKQKIDFWDTRERIETPDGDWFYADTKFTSNKAHDAGNDVDTTPMVILLHGLASSSRSQLSKDMAEAYNRQGMDCVCLNFRGATGTQNDKIGAYHLGFTDDVMHYLDLMRQRAPQRRIYLSGFSLGANVVLKLLGDLQDHALTEYNIHGAAVSCPPLDQEANAPVLGQPDSFWHRNIYTANLLKALKRIAQDRVERFANGDPDTDLFDYRGAMDAATITEFDGAFIAKVYGFDDAWDYYRRTSSVHVLDKITVPTLLSAAEDDPFMDPAIWPVEVSSEYGGPAPLKFVRQPSGGHLGFCFHRVPDDDDRLIESAASGSVDSSASAPCWSCVELARFLHHVDTTDRQS